ncbi:MAG: alpha/beta hydrolase [Candidatus Heimdallarchaeota archaeon]|nr:alpha/beta hydrolase [Candidatus Heimdallarchaeota archaeon]
MNELTHGTSQINSIQFAYTEVGEGDTVILIPGTLGDEYLFEKVQLALASDFHIIVLSHLNITSFDELIDVYHSIFTVKFELTNFHLGGSSVGGWIAQHYTMKYPDHVKSLIIGNSFADNTILRDQSLGLYKITRFIPWFIIKRLFERNTRKSLANYNPEIAEYFVQSLRSIKKTFLRRKLYWSLAPLPKLVINNEIPKLIIYTKDDSVVSFDNTEVLFEVYPEADVGEIEIGDHYPYRTNPDEYIAKLRAFLLRK